MDNKSIYSRKTVTCTHKSNEKILGPKEPKLATVPVKSCIRGTCCEFLTLVGMKGGWGDGLEGMRLQAQRFFFFP